MDNKYVKTDVIYSKISIIQRSQGDDQIIRIIVVFQISKMDMKNLYLAFSEISERSTHIHFQGKKI